jgi:hypothetical protein
MAVVANLYDWLMFFHIVAAMVWVGGLVALTVLATQALRSRQHDAVARFVGGFRVAGPLLFAPSMALSSAWGSGWSWTAMPGLSDRVGSDSRSVSSWRHSSSARGFQSRAAILAQRAVATGDHGEATRQLRRWSWGMRLILLLLLVVTWDMVFKPGA